MIIKYRVNDSGVKNHFGEVPDRNCYEDIAEMCAEHCYNNNQGFPGDEDSVVIRLFENENYIGKFEVFRVPAVYMVVKK